MKRLIIVGIPTWCEANYIREHTKRIDRALSISFPDDDKLIVNVDNCSPDGTASIFNSTETENRKVSISTEKGIKGKGHNFYNLFSYALEQNVDLLITLDADLEIIPDDWMPTFGKAILDENKDLAVPLYPRFWYDGNLTNQVVAPLVLAVTKIPIRQPIGGDFAFSPHCLKHLLSLGWNKQVLGFGIDIFLVMQALKAGLAIEQVPLSTGKIHSWRSDTADEVEAEMSDKFQEVVGTTFRELMSCKPDNYDSSLPDFPLTPEIGSSPKDYDVDHIIETAQICYKEQKNKSLFQLLSVDLINSVDELPLLDDHLWGKILRACLDYVRHNEMNDKFFDAVKALFFMRIAFVLPQLKDADIEARIIKVAESIAND